MKRTKAAIVGAISGLLVLASGTVGYGIGRDDRGTADLAGSARSTPEQTVASTSVAMSGAPAPAVALADGSARLSMPYPGPDFPGLPPYPGQAPESNGVHAVGVAYRETKDPKAKPGQDLVRQAFEDANRQARELAEASGVKLGKLVAVSDVKQTQPFYRACVDPAAGATPEAKPPAGSEPKILSAPAPDCSPMWYVVAWVFVRYELI